MSAKKVADEVVGRSQTLWDKTIVLPQKPISISLKPTESEILAPPYKPFLPDLIYAKASAKAEPEKKKEAPPLTGGKGSEKPEPVLPEAAEKKPPETKEQAPEKKEDAPDMKKDAPEKKEDAPDSEEGRARRRRRSGRTPKRNPRSNSTPPDESFSTPVDRRRPALSALCPPVLFRWNGCNGAAGRDRRLPDLR
jgi:hypothetical protein